MFTKFKNEVPKQPGFYVLKYREGHERKVWMDEPTNHLGNSWSYPVTMHNVRDENTCHDFGQYEWVNSYSVPYGPVEWRKMETAEAVEFGNTLFMFGRKSWAHPNGRKVLTPADVA